MPCSNKIHYISLAGIVQSAVNRSQTFDLVLRHLSFLKVNRTVGRGLTHWP